MAANMDQMSAFAVYSAERKKKQQSLNPKKRKRNQAKNQEANEQTTNKGHSNKVKDIWNNCQKISAIKKTHLKCNKSASLLLTKKRKDMTEQNSNDLQRWGMENNHQSEHKLQRKKNNSKYKKKINEEKEQIQKERSCNGKLSDIFTLISTNTNEENPIINSRRLFRWLVSPINIKYFFIHEWEKNPLYIARHDCNYYTSLISLPLLDKVLRTHPVFFTKNIDITSYHDGVRETHNPVGRAYPSIVWDYYLNDCSVRMLNPQTFIPEIHMLCVNLQELFGCFVGSNLYLTPPNSQGFAPHYDDIEAFILQIEGKKRWRLYKRNEEQYLARESSRDFQQSEIGEIIFDTVVNAGDLLYFPRGTIHQAETIDNSHSMHLTLSVYQKNSWQDLFERLLPQVLKQAGEMDSCFREGLPRDYLRHVGCAYSTSKDDIREAFKTKVKSLFTKLMDYIDIDKAADLMAVSHIHDFLPPVFSQDEIKCSVIENSEIMYAGGVVGNCVEILPLTKIRLSRSHCIRLVEEDNSYRIYYSTDNSKEYHGNPLQYLEVTEEFVPALKKIIRSYPAYICVKDLPIDNADKQIQLVKDLREKALIITDVPLTDIPLS